MLTGESAEADSTCTKVWHNPSSSRRGREPPGRHLSSARSQCCATEVDACYWPLCQALRPDSRTVAEATVAHLVVMPRAVRPKVSCGASSPEGEFAWRNRERFADVIPKDAPLRRCPKAIAALPARRLSHQLAARASWLCCCRSNEHWWQFEQVESPVVAANGQPRGVPQAERRASRRARPASQGMGLLSGESWLLLSHRPRFALAKRLTLLSQGVGVPEGPPVSRRSTSGVSPRRTAASRRGETPPLERGARNRSSCGLRYGQPLPVAQTCAD
jgi:hypothetical protein